MTYTSEAPYPMVTPSCHHAPTPPRAVMRLTPHSTDSFCLVFHTLSRCNPQVLHLCVWPLSLNTMFVRFGLLETFKLKVQFLFIPFES